MSRYRLYTEYYSLYPANRYLYARVQAPLIPQTGTFRPVSGPLNTSKYLIYKMFILLKILNIPKYTKQQAVVFPIFIKKDSHLDRHVR